MYCFVLFATVIMTVNFFPFLETPVKPDVFRMLNFLFLLVVDIVWTVVWGRGFNRDDWVFDIWGAGVTGPRPETIKIEEVLSHELLRRYVFTTCQPYQQKNISCRSCWVIKLPTILFSWLRHDWNVKLNIDNEKPVFFAGNPQLNSKLCFAFCVTI